MNRDEIVAAIHKAKFREAPANFKAFSASEIAQVNESRGADLLPRQEPGTRPSCALPYELYVAGNLSADKRTFIISMEAGNKLFGKKSAGAPFIIYAMNKYQQEELKVWNYAVRAGDKLTESWNLSDFEGGKYHLRVYGPNGFFREFSGSGSDTHVQVHCSYALDKKGKPTGDMQLLINNQGETGQTVIIADNSYQQKTIELTVAPGVTRPVVSLAKSYNWYDFNVQIGQSGIVKRFAGHVETGIESVTDPLMAG